MVALDSGATRAKTATKTLGKQGKSNPKPNKQTTNNKPKKTN